MNLCTLWSNEKSAQFFRKVFHQLFLIQKVLKYPKIQNKTKHSVKRTQHSFLSRIIIHLFFLSAVKKYFVSWELLWFTETFLKLPVIYAGIKSVSCIPIPVVSNLKEFCQQSQWSSSSLQSQTKTELGRQCQIRRFSSTAACLLGKYARSLSN